MQFSPHLCLETVFPALKLAQNCYIHYNVNIFFLKTGNLMINWLLLSEATCHTERLDDPHHLTKSDGKRTKISMFKHFMNWENFESASKVFKNPNFPSLSSIGKNLEVYTATFQNPDF